MRPLRAASDMAVLYDQNLEDDLLYWKRLNKRRGHLLNSTHLKVRSAPRGCW